jgi:hypothetical protein
MRTFLLLFLSALVGITPAHAQQHGDRDDWGHWRLGHRNDLSFLEANRLTVTFAGGAPHFERVTREAYDEQVAAAREETRFYRDRGYVVLRYMTSSVHGTTATSADDPEAHLLDLFDFYHNGGWEQYEDYLGSKPPPGEDPSTWLTVRADGTFPHYRYAPYGQETTGRFESWGCPNNPHFRNLMSARIRSQANTGVDGIYLDWTQIAGETCHCDHCRQAFEGFLNDHLPSSAAEHKYGTAAYEAVDLPTGKGHPFWMEWMEFRAHTLADFHRHLRTEARKVNPDFMLSGNVYGGFGFGPIAYDAAGHMELFGREGGHDFFYSEIQEYLDTAPHRTDEGVRVTNSPALRYLSAASRGKPVVVYATEITPPIFPEPTEQTLNAMAAINIAESVANQATFREKRETPPWATSLYNFLADNEGSLIGSRLDSDVAVVASVHQYLADRQSYAFSTSRVFSDSGLGHIFLVSDQLLESDLTDYRVIVLPQLPLLSVAAQERLTDYVVEGGNLILLGVSGRYDEHNVPLASSPLALLAGEGYGYELPFVRPVGKGQVRYIPVPADERAFLIEAKQAGEFTTFGPSLADRFADIPEGYTRGRIHPGLTERLLEVGRAVEEMNPAASRRLSEHPYVEFSTMRNDRTGRLLVHLVNYDVSIRGDVHNASDVMLRVALPSGRSAAGVRYGAVNRPFAGIPYEVRTVAGREVLHFVADGLEVYGLVLIDME